MAGTQDDLPALCHRWYSGESEMPEPDPRRTRLEALRLQLEPLARQAMAQPANSPERAALDDRVSEVLWVMVALREELES